MHLYRTHSCGQLRRENVGDEVRVSGWVHRVRDHGGLLFMDLRDHYGLIQCVIHPNSPFFALAQGIRAEWVLKIDGRVAVRSEETVNPVLATGDVEIVIGAIEVLSQAAPLPLPVFGEPDYPEETRLRYRFLDLRRETLHRNMMKRSAVVAALRKKMNLAGFNEFQTPILTASSPEGARDFLVPSRLHPGKFYALPQAPQQFKQLLMVAGFDRYFQIAPCFRDEDPRADRLPGEFYQLDLEMSFVTQEDVLTQMEPILREIFEEFGEGKPVTRHFPRLSFEEAFRLYGTDKPDLRNPIKMACVTEHFRDSGFLVFSKILSSNPKARIWAIPAKGGGNRAFCDRMGNWAQSEGQPGLGYILYRSAAEGREEGAGDEGVTAVGPIAKNLGVERARALQEQLELGASDAVFFVAGDPESFAPFAAKARDKIGKELGLLEEDRFELCWIIGFPFYAWHEDTEKIDFSHNPFSMPVGGLEALNTQDPLTIQAHQYDLVCNGYEIASGAIRNHRPDIMQRAFEIAGYDAEMLEQDFGGMLRALRFGAPPHGGMAAGLDRIVMLLCGAENLREVTLFPMNQQAEDLLMGAPAPARPIQLRELHLRLVPSE